MAVPRSSQRHRYEHVAVRPLRYHSRNARRLGIALLSLLAVLVIGTLGLYLERSLAIPTVLRLRYYVNVPRRNPPAWTRRGLLARDHYTCEYCGKQCSAREATVDHVLPVSRGGRSSWGNTVTACFRCNQRKADRTPHEAGMKLLIEPKLPRTRYLTVRGDIPSAWKMWIEI